MSNKEIVLEARHLSYSYSRESEEIPVLQEVNFSLVHQQRVALVGASGVGKSTLLHLLGLLDNPSSGEVILKDGEQAINTKDLTDGQRTTLRGQIIGFIYQFHHLLSEFTALENVMIPQLIVGKGFKKAREHAKHLLHLVGLCDRINHRPSQLSGGQQQRVAIARALANDPDILLADEPTGNLDVRTAHDIFHLFFSLSQEQGLSMIMATHNPELWHYFDRVISLQKGMLCEVSPDSHTQSFKNLSEF